MTAHTDRPSCVSHLARSFRRRIVLPEVPDDRTPSAVSMKAGLPSLRETLLFRLWVLRSPVTPERDIMDEDLTAGTPSHVLFNEDAVLHPFPEKLFWKERDEGEWDGDGVPAWIDVEDVEMK